MLNRYFEIQGVVLSAPKQIKTINGSRVHFVLCERLKSCNAQGDMLRTHRKHEIITFNALARKAENSLLKGQPILITGWNWHRTYTNAKGEKKFRESIVATDISLLPLNLRF